MTPVALSLKTMLYDVPGSPFDFEADKRVWAALQDQVRELPEGVRHLDVTAEQVRAVTRYVSAYHVASDCTTAGGPLLMDVQYGETPAEVERKLNPVGGVFTARGAVSLRLRPGQGGGIGLGQYPVVPGKDEMKWARRGGTTVGAQDETAAAASVSVEAWTYYVEGRGATEDEAFLDAARRLKARIEGMTVEQLAAVLDGEVAHDAPALPPYYRDSTEWDEGET